MLRVLLFIGLVIPLPGVSATEISNRQREAMYARVRELSPTLGDGELDSLVHLALFEIKDGITEDERNKFLIQAATRAAAAADRVLISARSKDLEATRVNLNELLRMIARAGRLEGTSSREEIREMSLSMLQKSIFGGVIVGGAGMFGGAFADSLAVLWSGGALAIGGTLGLFPLVHFGISNERPFNLPGATRLAQKYGRISTGVDFWGWMITKMKEHGGVVNTPEDLGKLIARELEGITLEQACTSALLESPSQN